MDADETRRALRASYDGTAEEYARRYAHELDHKPFDRELLEDFARRARGRGRVCDMGCGPGHVARFLRAHGADAFGMDLSPGMVELARRLNPGVDYSVGDMLALDVADDSWAGVVAFYSIIHVPRSRVVAALAELKRALAPGGEVLLAFHLGEEDMHLDDLWGQPVSLDFYFFSVAEMEDYVRAAGLEHRETRCRPPYPDVEYSSQRAYVLAAKPGGPTSGRA